MLSLAGSDGVAVVLESSSLKKLITRLNAVRIRTHFKNFLKLPI